MGLFTKRLIGGIAAVSLLAGGAFAQVSVLDDFEGKSNQNNFGDYWYFFDDNKEGSSIAEFSTKRGTSKVVSAKEQGSGANRELLFDPEVSLGGGQSSASAGLLSYKFGATFQQGYDNTSIDRSRNPTFEKCPTEAEATAAKWKIGCFPFAQFVGIGTNLVPDGSTNAPAGFQNATKITFWARSTGGPVSFRVFLEQTDIGRYGTPVKVKDGAYFGKWFTTVGSGWTQFEMPMNADPCTAADALETVNYAEDVCAGKYGLVQPQWALDQGFQGTLDLSKVVKIGWQVQARADADEAQGNLNPSADDAENVENELLIDNIQIHGFEFVARDMCKTCIVTSVGDNLAPKAFDQFGTGSPTNVLGWYWYAYDDTKTTVDPGTAKGNSEFGGDGVDFDNPWGVPGEASLVVLDNERVEIAFELGGAMMINNYRVNPFVGIGTNLYQDRDADQNALPFNQLEFFDATATNPAITGIAFDFQTNMSKITFEVQDNRDAGVGAPNPRPESAVWYTDLPGGTGWQTAVVPLDDRVLRMHTEWADVKEWADANSDLKPLNLSALAKFQFKIQAASGTEGELKIRNVRTLGGTISAKHVATRSAAASGIRATYNRGAVSVNWSAAQQIAGGKIQLVNTKGRVVSSANIANVSGNRVTANLGKGTLASGMYFVRIDARDVNGKRIVQQAPVSIVR